MKDSLRLASLALATLVVMTITGTTRADTNVVVPGGNAATEGDSNNGFPFDLGNFSIGSERYQQVYDASAFSALSGPTLLTDILFRPDREFGAAFSATLTNIQIDLSTTSKAVDGLSTTFADNVGADDTIVHSGSLALSSAFTGPAGGPKDFDILIHLTTPFTYDPASGNLLLDVRNFGGGTTTIFDSESPTGDAISRVITNSLGDVNSTTANGDVLPSSGLVTKFVFADAAPSAVPLPAAFPAGLALLGALGLTKRLTRK